MEHTKTPWAIEENNSHKPFTRVLRGPWKKEGDGSYLAYLNCSENDERFLIEAINNYDPLISLLKDLIDLLDGTSGGGGLPKPILQKIKQIPSLNEANL